eukprot:1579190-Amphidinium_carterae.1
MTHLPPTVEDGDQCCVINPASSGVEGTVGIGSRTRDYEREEQGCVQGQAWQAAPPPIISTSLPPKYSRTAKSWLMGNCAQLPNL